MEEYEKLSFRESLIPDIQNGEKLTEVRQAAGARHSACLVAFNNRRHPNPAG